MGVPISDDTPIFLKVFNCSIRHILNIFQTYVVAYDGDDGKFIATIRNQDKFTVLLLFLEIDGSLVTVIAYT